MHNPDPILPIYVPPRRAYTLLSIDLHPYNSQTIPPSTSNTVAAPNKKRTWFAYIVEYAHVIGLAIAAVGIVVAIIAVVVK
jgi:hypothetical protein